ncbi:MAG TPA: helix-turn-helix domain-containing protein [Candidatus Nanoarchaeia archaeon]|nr:helix-turn-helix domain-containing protein [Candidatus Nanoarchaeia archaeon]
MNQKCTIYRTANFIGKRWTLLILLELSKRGQHTASLMDAKGFLQLKKNLPLITSKILSSRLKELELEGLIAKKIDSRTFPKKSEYSLTKSGKEFLQVIKELKRWSLRWKFQNDACEQIICQNCRL